jgi:hypothetical protein
MRPGLFATRSTAQMSASTADVCSTRRRARAAAIQSAGATQERPVDPGWKAWPPVVSVLTTHSRRARHAI